MSLDRERLESWVEGLWEELQFVGDNLEGTCTVDETEEGDIHARIYLLYPPPKDLVPCLRGLVREYGERTGMCVRRVSLKGHWLEILLESASESS